MFKTKFEVPDENSRVKAIGSLEGTPLMLNKALNIITPKFKPIDLPEPNDWLASHREEGQTFETYKSTDINWIKPPRDSI